MSAAPREAIHRAAAERQTLVQLLRRELHEIPELAFQEVETTRLVAEFLATRGITFTPSRSGTGGIAVVGGGDGAGVILRADLDALPVDEPADHPCRSRHPGRMHACGHDAHAAMLLATADALADPTLGFRGRAVCVFQPAEEGPGGCRRLLEEGLLEKHPVGSAVALHVWPQLATGQVGLEPGPRMAGMDRITLTFHGLGGHGAYPHACIDPVVMAAEAVLSLQTIVSRRLDPLEPGVVTLGSIHGGTAANVISDSVELLGTTRFYNAETRRRLREEVERVGHGVASAHGGRFELRFDEGYPVTRNDPRATETVAAALREVLGDEAVVAGSRTMGAEDMGYLLERVPGCYVQLGSSAAPNTAPPLHSARFSLDEACLPVGVEAFLAAAFALDPPAEEPCARTTCVRPTGSRSR
ncbi:MAG: amidohydrolase [Deltaproteobacteria bacterium]|nr:amidohydrolase [Deltaproteobacteria bacterium]